MHVFFIYLVLIEIMCCQCCMGFQFYEIKKRWLKNKITSCLCLISFEKLFDRMTNLNG